VDEREESRGMDGVCYRIETGGVLISLLSSYSYVRVCDLCHPQKKSKRVGGCFSSKGVVAHDSSSLRPFFLNFSLIGMRFKSLLGWLPLLLSALRACRVFSFSIDCASSL
jgi:hypothetical protein